MSEETEKRPPILRVSEDARVRLRAAGNDDEVAIEIIAELEAKVARLEREPLRASLRQTRTYAVLEVPPRAYAFVREKLIEADYLHVFDKHDGREVIDMHGIAIAAFHDHVPLASVMREGSDKVTALRVAELAEAVLCRLPRPLTNQEIAELALGAWFLLDPVDVVLHCPRCGAQHVDAQNPAEGWTNPPHRTHKCAGCGQLWRPSDRATNGVQTIQSGPYLR